MVNGRDMSSSSTYAERFQYHLIDLDTILCGFLFLGKVCERRTASPARLRGGQSSQRWPRHC